MKRQENVREEQIIYARWLNTGMKLGLIFLFISFSVYITGLLPMRIAISNFSVYWEMKVSEFIQETHMQSGWSNWHLMYEGDLWCFISMAFLGVLSIICYFRIMLFFLAKKNLFYATIAFLEILILLFAAFVGNVHSFV